MANMPVNIPQRYTHDYALIWGAGIAKPDDEMIHDYARSRSSCSNVVHTYRGESLLTDLHWPVQKPMNASMQGRDQRAAQFDELAPVGAGYNATRDWLSAQFNCPSAYQSRQYPSSLYR